MENKTKSILLDHFSLTRSKLEHSAHENPEPPEEPDEADDTEKSKKSNTLPEAIDNKLFKQRKVLIFGGIDDKIAREVTARLLALLGESDKPIDVYINSPGGHVESGDTIHDMIRFVDSVAPINIIGTGWVASAGALIFAAGHKNRRFCLPNTRFLLHQPMGGVRGPATDIDIEAREIIKMRERLNRIFSKETGHSYEKIAKDTDRNYWMSAQEAIDYGLVTKIISRVSDLS
ncbi:MAG: ATP-dependent Clp protease proteolytic subunit [Acetobacter sp.]|nr:ATP-dependent Clp protease proteolytic subunit [Acetobacter sp.]